MYCPKCRKPFHEPEDEQGEHGCPRCGEDPGRKNKEPGGIWLNGKRVGTSETQKRIEQGLDPYGK